MSATIDSGKPSLPTDSSTRWGAVVTLALATLVVASEMTLAAMALPLISSEFAISPSATAWVLLAYTLPLVALAIPAGRWVDGADVRLVYLCSLTLVALTGIASAWAPSFPVLLASRVLQGMASALYLAVYMPVVATSVGPAVRGRAISIIASIMMLGSVALTPLGGLVAESFGWRAVFLLKVPFLAIVVVLGHHLLARTHVGAPLRQRLPVPSVSLLVESLLIGAGTTALLLGLERSGADPLLAGALGVAGLAVLMAWKQLEFSRPIVALLARPRFATPALSLSLIAAITGLTGFTLPFFVLEVVGAGPQALSIVIMSFVLAAAVISPVAGGLADRWGPLPVATAGAALTALALLSFLALGPDATLIELTLCTGAAGAGMSVFNAPNMAAMLQAAPADMTGTASGISGVARMLGSTMGPATAAIVWTASDGGTSALHNTVLVLATMAGAGFVALLLGNRSLAVAPGQPNAMEVAPQARDGR
ncbi:MFS transporter [Gilvimarinus sp. F26214L]|uniref:MFS transporter n=1 Tax=Gilvimarinus sp. DZF01 TaxID=3461371 RepID=UPI004045E6A3